MTLTLFEKSRERRPGCHGLSDLCRHRSAWARCDQNMDWSGGKSGLYMLTSDLTSLVPPQFSGHWLQVRKVGTVYFFLFLQEPITYFYYYFFLTGMNWKLHSIVHGQIHLATQFTNGVKWHFQNSPLEAGFLVVKGKKMRRPLPSPAKTTELEVREVSQTDFWDISSHPTSVLSFSQISWP